MTSTANMNSPIAESSSAFSRHIFAELGHKQNENVVFSPVSIQTCIAMAFFGSKGNTQSEIAKGLHFVSCDKKAVGACFNGLFKKSNNSVTMTIANKIYVNKNFQIKNEFNTAVRETFQSEAETIDFSTGAQAATKINNWVERKTNSNIKNLVKSVDSDVIMVFVNAVHLKAKWKYLFSNYATHKANFWITLDKSVEVDTMSNSDDYKYAEWSELDAVAVDLPYHDSDLSMVVVLPNKRDGLNDLESKLKDVNILKLTNEMTIQDVDIYLPKFKIESEFDLKKTFQNMGMSTMFSDRADFSDLFEDSVPAKVSKVIHKAFINVDEDGTEASAATYMKIVPMSLNLRQKVVKFDYPFLYFIKNQDYIYFMGHVAHF